MYLVPSEVYQSLMTRMDLNTDPTLNAQIVINKEKDKIFKRRKKSDEKVTDLANILHKESVLNEQIKIKQTKPQTVQLVNVGEPKKRGRPPKITQTYPEYEISGSGDKPKRQSFIDNFYMYEPAKRKSSKTKRDTVTL